MVVSLGIDPSISGTGLVALRESNFNYPDLVFEREIVAPKGTSGLQRVQLIAVEIMSAIHELKPDVIVIEGYSLHLGHASSVVPLVELGGVLRFLMMLDGLKWLDPRASVLKKFVTGKGTAQKDQMMMWVLKRWGHTSKSNNTADAYGLACIGLASMNRLHGISKEMLALSAQLPLRCN
ncbi:crossover junction endodeoxyribonuclease RuvC [Hyphomicrobium sp. ghe19]|uniref:crossover junction endodeoxyribonuclease RuvC n=1 Tax=Hyphomicrobium sp. ghe19 TaxID=2682968 RepID=UPI0013669552|nr:Crossover junction endodeoxyribonuclease RuvC [Hyphomicrobium sp. ghe19]